MIIQFHKKQDKPHTLRCIRADGSVTWSTLKTGFDIDHDLTHYAVEKTVPFNHGFYGLLKSGVNINDWQLPKEERPINLKWNNLPLDARHSEIVVGVFQGTPNNNEFWDNLTMQLTHFNLPELPQLTPSVYAAILLKMNELRTAWRDLEVNDILELEF